MTFWEGVSNPATRKEPHLIGKFFLPADSLNKNTFINNMDFCVCVGKYRDNLTLRYATSFVLVSEEVRRKKNNNNFLLKQIKQKR